MMTVRIIPITTVLDNFSSGLLIAPFPPFVVVLDEKHSALLRCFNCFAAKLSRGRVQLGRQPTRRVRARRAARWPESTAPSIGAGNPVSVQSPARNRLL